MRFRSHVRIQFQANSRFDLLHLNTRHRWLNLWQFLAYKLSRGFGIAMAIHGFCFAVHWHGDCEVVKHLSIQELCNSSRNWQPLGPEYIPHQHYAICHPLQMSCDWTLMFHLYTSGKTTRFEKPQSLCKKHSVQAHLPHFGLQAHATHLATFCTFPKDGSLLTSPSGHITDT